MQASAELQLAARVDGITQQDIRDALWRDRTLVKAWTLRGTLHLHPADELALWFAARRAVSGEPGGLAAWPDPNGVVHAAVTADELKKIREAVWEALDGRTLLREELMDGSCPSRRQEAPGSAAVRVRILHRRPGPGAAAGKQGHLRAPGPVDQGLERSQATRTRRCARSAAAISMPMGRRDRLDFRSWFGQADFAAIDTQEVSVAGRRAFVLADDTKFPEPQPSVRLLPEYDVYIMGSREREQLVPEPVRKQVAAHGRGRYEGAAGVRFLVVDGIAAGLWERKKTAKRIELTVRPAGKLTRAQRAELDDEVERIGAFLAVEPALTLE